MWLDQLGLKPACTIYNREHVIANVNIPTTGAEIGGVFSDEGIPVIMLSRLQGVEWGVRGPSPGWGHRV